MTEDYKQKALGSKYDLSVWIDGELLSREKASISVWDHGLLYGDGVFEGIRVYNGAVYRLYEHLDRLFDSARAIKLKIEYSRDQIARALGQTLVYNSLQAAHCRVIVTRGVGQPGLDPGRSPRSTTIIMCYPLPSVLGEGPVRLLTSSIRKKSPYSIDSKIKSLNYMDSVLAKLQATSAGFDDAILLDSNSYVAEATGMNVIAVKGKTLFVPRTTAALHGITRAFILSVADELGLAVKEGDFTVYDFYLADEVFLSGTGVGLVPVSEIDGRAIGTGTREVFDSIKKRYDEDIRKSSIDIAKLANLGP